MKETMLEAILAPVSPGQTLVVRLRYSVIQADLEHLVSLIDKTVEIHQFSADHSLHRALQTGVWLEEGERDIVLTILESFGANEKSWFAFRLARALLSCTIAGKQEVLYRVPRLSNSERGANMSSSLSLVI